MIATSEVLRSVPLFSGMTDAAVERIGDLAEPADYPAGAILVREGDPGDSFIVIVDGRAEVERGGRSIREISSGDFLGEISLIDHGPRTATVRALEPIQALVVSCAGFERLMSEYPAVRYGILSALTQRIRSQAGTDSD